MNGDAVRLIVSQSFCIQIKISPKSIAVIAML